MVLWLAAEPLKFKCSPLQMWYLVESVCKGIVQSQIKASVFGLFWKSRSQAGNKNIIWKVIRQKMIATPLWEANKSTLQNSPPFIKICFLNSWQSSVFPADAKLILLHLVEWSGGRTVSDRQLGTASSRDCPKLDICRQNCTELSACVAGIKEKLNDKSRTEILQHTKDRAFNI